jgi:hypothetical protein
MKITDLFRSYWKTYPQHSVFINAALPFRNNPKSKFLNAISLTSRIVASESKNGPKKLGWFLFLW